MSGNYPAGVTDNDFTDESGDVCEHSAPICLACEEEDARAQLERCRNEWCDNFLPADRDEGVCPECEAKFERDKAYWFSIFDREPKAYTREEVEDAYSASSEYQKREAMLREIEK